MEGLESNDIFISRLSSDGEIASSSAQPAPAQSYRCGVHELVIYTQWLYGLQHSESDSRPQIVRLASGAKKDDDLRHVVGFPLYFNYRNIRSLGVRKSWHELA